MVFTISNMTDEVKAPIRNDEVDTVQKRLDGRIGSLRQELQNTMELRAKAEYLGCLNYPMSFIERLQGYPF
jgi:hypothetical protein